MTPSAMTSAGRTGARASRAATAPSAPPRPVRAGATARTAAPRPVRAGATARTAAPRPARSSGAHAPRPARSTAPRAPRRVSGPVRRPASGAQRPLAQRLALGSIAFLRALPDHRWVDRLVRGRAWIPVLGVLLAGIVATQVEVLKLGASMGRWMERSAALTSHNQALQASVASLSDDQRIERLAAHMGMVMPPPTAITFLSRRRAGGERAALAGIHAPDPTQFLATLQSQAALAASATTAPSTSVTPSTTSAASAAAAATTTGG